MQRVGSGRTRGIGSADSTSWRATSRRGGAGGCEPRAEVRAGLRRGTGGGVRCVRRPRGFGRDVRGGRPRLDRRVGGGGEGWGRVERGVRALAGRVVPLNPLLTGARDAAA